MSAPRASEGPNWAEIVDVNQAAKNCFLDMAGDWHRDPWGWAELRWVAKERPQLAYERLGKHGVKAPGLLDVPKENFVLRPAVVLDVLDRLCYQALVDRESGGCSGRSSRGVTAGGCHEWIL